MILTRYVVTFFNHLDWQHQEVEILALDEASMRSCVEGLCEEQYRHKPVYRVGEQPLPEDSLRIVSASLVEIPFVMNCQNF